MFNNNLIIIITSYSINNMPPKKNNKQKTIKINNAKLDNKPVIKQELESDSDSEPNEIINKTHKSSNAFGGFLMDSDSDKEEEDEDEDEKEEEEEKKEKVNDNFKNNKQKNKIITIEDTDDIKIKMKSNKKNNNENKGEKKNNKNIIDTGKTNLFVEDVELIINGKTLIHESPIVINSETKYTIVGHNGIGKSCLSKYIYNKLKDNIDILMIDQNIQIEDNETIHNFILKANEEMFEKNKKLEVLSELEELSDQQSNEYNEISEYLSVNEWDKFNAESKRILKGLGFNNINGNTNILSGGWRMRLAIGKALLRKPKILILDECTNFLDLEAVVWLTNYLVSYKETLITITHQIDFINTISNIIWYVGNIDMTGTKVHTIRGNYDNVIKKINEANKELDGNYDKFQKKIKELRNKSKPKKEVDEFIKNNGVPRPPKEYIVNIQFDNITAPGSDKIIDFRQVDYSYNKETNEEKLIFKNLNISLNMNTKIVLLGRNGSGKTTFFKLSNEDIKPNDGIVIRNERLRVGYYNQHVADTLPLDLNAIEYLQTINSSLHASDCRAILGKLGIKKTGENNDLCLVQIKNLSGGQKVRVTLASIQMKKPHLLLLDEVSSHLDIESMDGLIKGINAFNGGIILITHDIYLIEHIKDAVLYEVKDKNLIKFNGEFSEYCDKFKN
jgi:ATPase subunit of ABC transporter with duplicated ATPase domains